jgi:hypothetical protein
MTRKFLNILYCVQNPFVTLFPSAALRDGNHRELSQGEGKGASKPVKKTVMESKNVLDDFYHGIAGQCLGLTVIASLSLQRPWFDVGFVVDEVLLDQVSLLVCISVFPSQNHPTNVSPVLYVSSCLCH